jgi:predicted nucleic-acid-binding Zn-ribbon protein
MKSRKILSANWLYWSNLCALVNVCFVVCKQFYSITLFVPVCSIIHTKYNYYSQSHQFLLLKYLYVNNKKIGVIHCNNCTLYEFHSSSSSGYEKLLQEFLRAKIVAEHWPTSSTSMLCKYGTAASKDFYKM